MEIIFVRADVKGKINFVLFANWNIKLYVLRTVRDATQ